MTLDKYGLPIYNRSCATAVESSLLFTNASCRGLAAIRVARLDNPKGVPVDIMGFIMGIVWLPVVLVVLVIAALAYFLVLSRWKKVKGNEVLVVSGTKRGVRVSTGGGAFVSPFQSHSKFSTAVLDLNGDGKEAPTKPKVLVVVDWNAQVRPDSTDEQQLIRAYQDYYGAYDPREIIQSLEKVLTGELRNVIGEMTPEQLRHEKEEFNNRVTEGASKRMKALGFELVNLNLSDVTDKNGYFDNTATAELEDKRQTAANIKAESDRNIRVVKANADQMAKDAEIAAQLITDERELDASIKRAEYKTQRDTAEADAEVAGELQRTKRAQEVAVNEGAVAVVKAQQDQLAADAERAAIMTRAETARKREVVEAEAEKDKAKIKAAADADKAEIAAEAEAKVAERKAAGQARAAREEAQGRADAINLTAEADADKVRKTGLAEAEVERAKGEARAAAILAEGKAEAEAERELAEARAAHGGVNKEIEIAKINATARVEIANAYGTAMHEVGKNVTILQTGGGGASGGGNLLTNLLGGLPGLAKELDVQSEVLNGTSFNNVLAGLVNSIKGNAPAVVVAGEVTDTADGGFQLPEDVTLDSLAAALGVDTADIVNAAQSLEVPASDGEIAATGDSE